MKISPAALGTVFVCVFGGGTFVAAQTSDRPNIVVILADDLGFSDLGCYGAEIDTPRLDAIARRGIQMTQFYNTAKCHSSRVALLTGLYCDQAGAESMARGTTIARQLRDVGYRTLMTGKWHLDGEPTDRGFDRYFGHLSGATNFFRGDETFRINGERFDDFGDDFYTTVANTDYAIEFVDEAVASKKPFFLYVAHNAPHYPLHARRADYEKYLGRYDVGWDEIRRARYRRQVESGLIDAATTTLSKRPADVPAWDTLTPKKRRWESQRMAAYAAMIDALDQQVGRLVDHLEKKGVFENTLFVFLSDNGACPFERTRGAERPPYDPESYWTYDRGWAHVGNTPFRLYKQNSHEGGITSPAILHWPAGMKAAPGTIDRHPAHLVDIMATCLQVAGGAYPQRVDGRRIEPLVGRSLVPILAGKKREPHAELYFQFGPNRGLRQGAWKLVTNRSGPWELYDLSRDRSETENLVDQHPERVERMRKRWHAIAREVDRLPENQLKPVRSKPPRGKNAFH